MNLRSVRSQLSHSNEYITCSRRTHSMQNLSSDYIVGLVDGEGSFTVYTRDPDSKKQVKRRVVIEPKFYIKLVEKDKEILERVQQFFGCGSLYFQKDSRPNHQNCYRYEVYSHAELLTIIIPFFKKHRLQFHSKRNDFELFCQIMRRIKDGKHLQTNGLRELFELKQHMH